MPDGTDQVLRAIGERVRAARVEAGLTQEEAASASDIDYKRWQRIEQGEVNVTVRTLVRVADACRLDFFSLLASHEATGGDETRRARLRR